MFQWLKNLTFSFSHWRCLDRSNNIIGILNLWLRYVACQSICIRIHPFNVFLKRVSQQQHLQEVYHPLLDYKCSQRTPTASPLGSKSCMNYKKTREQKREWYTQWSLHRQWDYKLVTYSPKRDTTLTRYLLKGKVRWQTVRYWILYDSTLLLWAQRMMHALCTYVNRQCNNDVSICLNKPIFSCSTHFLQFPLSIVRQLRQLSIYCEENIQRYSNEINII